MKTIWNDQDIIIVNNIRVLNKDATVRFYEMYKDKFVNPIDVDKQLFTEEWAIKVIEKYPIKSLEELIEEDLLNINPLTKETFMRYIMDLPQKHDIKDINKIKEFGYLFSKKFNIVFDEKLYKKILEEKMYLNYVEKFALDTIFNDKVKTLDSLLSLLKALSNGKYKQEEVSSNVISYLEKNNYFSQYGKKSMELGEFLKLLNSEHYAFNNIIDSICDKFNIEDINIAIENCLKGKKIEKKYNYLNDFIKEYLKENKYESFASGRYLELLIYNIYKKFPKVSDFMVRQLIINNLNDDYEFNEANITLGIVLYRENMKLNHKIEKDGLDNYMDKYVYNYLYGIKDGLINSHLYLNEANWKLVVKDVIERTYRLYNLYKKEQITYNEAILLKKLLVDIKDYSIKYNSKMYSLLLSALKIDILEYKKICKELDNNKWNEIKKNNDKLLREDILSGRFDIVHDYLLNEKERKVIDNQDFLDSVNMSFDKICYLSASKNFKNMLIIDARHITYEQLIEYLSCLYYKDVDNFAKYCDKLGYSRIKGIHDLLKQFEEYPYDCIDPLIEDMDKRKELEVDKIFKRKKPNSKKSKRKTFYSFIIGSSIISSIYMSMNHNTLDVVNYHSKALDNILSNTETLECLNEKIDDKTLFVLDSLDTFYSNDDNVKSL